MYGALSTSFTCLSLLTSSALAQDETKHVIKSQAALLVEKAPVTAFASTTKSIVAVGSYGHVLINENNSAWQQKIVPTDTLLTSISFSGDDLGWAVGHDATIIHTQDGGSTWNLQQYLPTLDRPLLDVLFLNHKQGIAVGAYGMFYRTNDGGTTWNKQFLESLLPEEDIEYLDDVRSESEEDYQFEISSILPHFNKIIALKDKRLLLVGELGLIAFSNDGGKSWERQDNIYEGSFFTAKQTQLNTILVAGLRGHIYRSTDNGLTWQSIVLVNNNSVNDIYQSSNGDIYLTQNTGIVLKSIDDGMSFVQDSIHKGQDLMAVSELNNQLWLAGSKGLNRLKEVSNNE